jgi:hypothetical protein
MILKKKSVEDKMKTIGYTDEEMDKVIDNPVSLWITNRIIKRLCRKCKSKVTNYTMKYNLKMKREWLCPTCIRIYDFEIEESRGLTE